ncbi:MAG TPA: ROK family transcriptional regulator [Solirubrobacteraceae bacterium]|jgi:predicted NBD/HSP70 family sugar kinase|nr:ROK family transcriptional regulator [Solirubrobacteraceae bacterium]
MARPSQDSSAAAESRLSLLRELGEQSVLETIFRRGPITRPEIAIAAELSKPTVSAAVSRLEQGGLIRATGRRTGQRGRSPIAYMVSKQVGFVVGGDIGGSNLRVAAADLFGEPICDLKQPTTKAGGRALGMQLLEMVTEVIDSAGAVHGRPLALAISTPGIIDQSTGRVTSLAYNVAPEGGFDPIEVIRDRLDIPVLVENNVNLAAVGEKWFGLARGVSTMVFILLGVGIGMGIVIDDEVVRGAHGAAGEIGYLPLSVDPFNPRHRLHGGLEDEIGAAGIVSAYNDGRAGADPELSAVQEVFELAAKGNESARTVVDLVAARLGTAIATVCAILDPELVVLGGGIGSSPLLLSPVRGAAASLVPITARIETSLLGDRAALRGAIAVALNTARATLLSAGAATPARAQPARTAPRR